MLKLFENLKEKDAKAISEYSLDSQVLMEVAAKGAASKIIEIAYSKESFYCDLLNGFIHSLPNKKILQIVCGSGDNGGDGFALSRMLQDYFNIIIVAPFAPKSNMCTLQKKRLELLGLKVQTKLEPDCDIFLDALFGTGFTGTIREGYAAFLNEMNEIDAIKVALDVPSGLNISGLPCKECFRADFTICIGALRVGLYSSLAKDYVGKLSLVRLPLPSEKYEGEAETFLLQKNDAILPYRKWQNVNKSSFGHVAVVQGEKKGAALLVASAALRFGAGLVTIVGEDVPFIKADFMQDRNIPETTTCISLGSGLGRSSRHVFHYILSHLSSHKNVSLVLDADVFYYDELKIILDAAPNILLTPHPKEFQSLLGKLFDLSLSIEEIREKKLEIMRMFCKRYPHAILILKDCNTCIGQNNKIYINALGSPSLAKAGTGDVLAGMVASLLAQGYEGMEAAITASVTHAIASTHNVPNNYSLTASDLIEKLATISF